MKTAILSPDAIRHRLLEGVLLRLARRPDADEFIVRGGMLLRHWFQPLPRPADDLDLVATFPFSVEEATARFLPVLAEDVGDGAVFGPARAEGIWQDSPTPGVRVFASGTVGGEEADFHVDITSGPTSPPAPVAVELPTAWGPPARVLACRPEAVAGQKVLGLWHRGMLGWRQKDLHDLRLLLARVPMHAGDLRCAVAEYMSEANGTMDDVRALFGPSSWWGMKFAAARWLDFVKASRERDVPRELAGVVAEVSGRLRPILEGLP